MMRSAILIALFMTTVACSAERGDAWVKGSLFVPKCEDGESLDESCSMSNAVVVDEACNGAQDTAQCGAFDLQADFVSLEVFGDESAKMRIQRGGQDLALSDGLVFEIQDIRRLRGGLGDTVAVGPDANIRAAMALFGRCPDGNENFELRGTVTFTHFGNRPGDRISGCVDVLEVRNGRGEEPGEVLGFLQGGFDFVYQRGTPYQRFSR